jgi:hypothetical protein
MDLTNISVLLIPLGITTLQSGIILNEDHINFITRFSNGSLYSLLAIILSYMKIMSFEKVTIALNSYTMNGFDFAVCFLVLIAILLLVHYLIVDQVKPNLWRCFWSIMMLLFALIPSFFIVFYEHYLI